MGTLFYYSCREPTSDSAQTESPCCKGLMVLLYHYKNISAYPEISKKLLTSQCYLSILGHIPKDILGYNEPVLTGILFLNILPISHWTGENNIPVTGVLQYSSNAKCGLLCTFSAFLISCFWGKNALSTIPFSFGYLGLRKHSSNCPIMYKLFELSTNKGHIITNNHLRNAMPSKHSLKLGNHSSWNLITQAKYFWTILLDTLNNNLSEEGMGRDPIQNIYTHLSPW